MTNQNPDLDQLTAAELRQRLIAAQEENQALTEAFQTITFELRSQLTVIAGAAHLLLEKDSELFAPLPKEQAEMAEMAANGANRASEIIYRAMEMVEQAKGVENLGASLLLNYRRELQEANQQLDKLRLKYQAKNESMIRFIGSIFHQTRAPAAMALGFAKLILMECENTTSRSDIVKFVQGIKKAVERIQEADNWHVIWWRMLQLFEEPLVQTKIFLAEIENFEEVVGMPIKTDLAQIPPILANAEVLITVIKSLGYGKRDDAELIFSQDAGQVFVTLSNTPYQSYLVKEFLDSESGRLVYSVESKIFEPIGIVIALVEKYGGAVYAELGNDSTYTLSFTLPIYQEES
ncbi:MAG: hypothetical protein WAS33_11110 [Candidatus Promineifilaceae bacterium]|nr:hypothetical protein [Anaerolineaceae bacterium]